MKSKPPRPLVDVAVPVASRRPTKPAAVRFRDGQAQRVDDLVSGFQRLDGKRSARPVGIAVGPGGALYFTRDSNGLFRSWRTPLQMPVRRQ